MIGSLVLALVGVALTAAGEGVVPMGVAGLAWLLVSAGLRLVSNHSAKTAALIQEQFDTTLFYLPWRDEVAGEQVPDHDIAQLENRVKRGGVADRRITAGWYDPTDGLHHPLDVLVSQEQNLAWDSRLRRRYARTVLGVAIVWTLIGIGLCLGSDAVIDPLTTFFVPSLGAYGLAGEIWNSQIDIASERERLAKDVRRELHNAASGPISVAESRRLRGFARNVQDGILRTRLSASRVPEWFYKRFRTSDEADFASAAEQHRRRLV